MTAPPSSLASATSAAARSIASVPIASVEATVGGVRDYLLSSPRFDSAADVVVVDDGRLVGLVRIEDLLFAADDAPISELMDDDPPTIGGHVDQEEAAWKSVEHGQGSLAVVDDAGLFVGLIPSWRMLGVLLHEHDEDMARLAGYLHQGVRPLAVMTTRAAP